MPFDGFTKIESLPDVREIERTVLGAVLLDESIFRQLAPLGITDFTQPFHRAVFAAMLELSEEAQPLDPVLIHELVRRDNPESDHWSVGSVTNLFYGLPHDLSIREYVSQIREASACVSAIRKTEKLCTALAAKKISVKKFAAELAALESELRDDYPKETDSFQPLSLILQNEIVPTLDAYFRQEASEFLISTGIPQIDDILGGGCYLSDMIAIVAPPKSAKSAFALQLALGFAEKNAVGLLSLEMSNLQNGFRFIAQKSYADSRAEKGTLEKAVSAGWLRPGMFEATYKQAIETALTLFDTNLFLCQKPLTWSEVQAETRRLVKEKNLKVLIVDYWQLVFHEKKGNTRADNLAEIAKGLKQLGQELGIVVVALGQFNQEGLKLREKTGKLSTVYLEGSGELVKSANIVLTIDIEESQLNNRSAPRAGTLTFKPLRSGADAQLPCLFLGEYLTVEIIDEKDLRR